MNTNGDLNNPEIDIFVYIGETIFSNLSLEDKIKVKNLQQKPSLDLSQKDGRIVRRFPCLWYKKYSWLAGSKTLKKYFCFPCKLFGGDGPYGKEGTDIIANFVARANKHEISRNIYNCRIISTCWAKLELIQEGG